MIRTFSRSLALTLALGSAAPAFANEEDVVKPLKTVIGSVRYGKDKAALKQFAGEEQGRLLLGDDWNKATPEQKKEFLDLFHTLFAKIAFPKIRQNFEHLGTVLYDEPKVDGQNAQVASTLVIQHPLMKQGGMGLLLQKMRDKNKELASVTLK